MQIKIGQRAIPLWLIVAIALSAFTSGAMANYVWETITLNLEVEEPLEIISYPHELNLFPGETKEFNITVENHASVNLTVVLDFSLGNATYQDNYVTFGETYTVIPGRQELTAWILVRSNAPPIKTSLAIHLERVADSSTGMQEADENLVIENVKWNGMHQINATSVDIAVRNTGFGNVTMIDVQVNDAAPTAYDLDTDTAGNQTFHSLAPAESGTIRIWGTYVSGEIYEFVIITLSSNSTYRTPCP